MCIHFTKLRGATRFNESIKSKYTKKNYNNHINRFRKFINVDSIDELANISHDDMQVLLENYLLALKHTTNPNSIPSMFLGIKHFCIINRIKIDWDIIRKMFPTMKKTQNLRSYTTAEIEKMLSNCIDIRDKSLIHFLASTGARIGVFDHELSMKHIKKMPEGCKAVKLYAEEIEEYWSFLTPQASSILDTYHTHRLNNGEEFCNDTPVFATKQSNPKQLGWNGARSVIYRTVSKSRLIHRQKHEGRYNVQVDHGFRKRFNTTLKLENSINYNIAEKLMGHKNGLDGVYFTPTIHEMFVEFKKIMYKLHI